MFFKELMKEETLSSKKMIKHCTDCSDRLMFDVMEKSGSAFILPLILKEIFKKIQTGQDKAIEIFNCIAQALYS